MAKKANEKYGHKTAHTRGMEGYNHYIIPTGIMTLDYQLGTGGWRGGSMIEVFGPPSIGKTTIFGYSALSSAQKADMLTATILVEPEFDETWASRFGVNEEYNVLFRPNNAEEAMDMLRDLVFDADAQFILFDSLGALSQESEQKEDGTKKVGGASGLISWAIPRIMPRAYKNDVSVMFVNHIRDVQNSKFPAFYAPGGHAKEHAALMRIQVKPGKDKYTAMIDGEKVMVGRSLIAQIVKGKAHGAMGKTAHFDFYHHDVEGMPFGIDRTTDVLNIGKLTKVIEPAGAWLKHDLFPDGKLNGKNAFAKWLGENPEAYDALHKEVIEVMRGRQAKRAAKPELKVVNGGKGQ